MDWRVVVVTDDHPLTWALPPAELHSHTNIHGGFRTMHELAVAAAASGRTVELRGLVSAPILDALTQAAGARPELPGEARPPGARDIIVVPEGSDDPLRTGRYVLSPARLVVALLAPPGLFGWPFVLPWQRESPLTVALDTLAREQHFRAMAALDIDLWTHMGRAHELARAAGARCELIGSGDPAPAPSIPAVKDTPVVYLQANRWRPLAEQVARRLRTPAHAIVEGPHETVMAELARAKVLLMPARVEGHGRLLWEARARGTVVVGLRSQVYATGLDEASGAVAVEDLERMPAAVEVLLDDPQRLHALSQAGRASAAEQVDWGRYLERVDAAITATEQRQDAPHAGARRAFGERLGELLEDRLGLIERVGELDAQLAVATARVQVLDDALEDAREALERLRLELDRTGAQAASADGAHAGAGAPASNGAAGVLLRKLARRGGRPADLS